MECKKSAKAKANLKKPTGGKKSLTLQNSVKSINTQKEVAKLIERSIVKPLMIYDVDNKM